MNNPTNIYNNKPDNGGYDVNLSYHNNAPANKEEPAKPNKEHKENVTGFELTIGTAILLAIFFIIAFVRKLAPQGMEFAWVVQSIFDTDIISGADYYNSLGFFERYWPLVGYQFLHGGAFHLIMNSAFLLQVGSVAEIGLIGGVHLLNYREAKANKQKRIRIYFAAFLFIIYFIICGIASAYGYYLFNLGKGLTLIGASGSISGVFAGYLMASYFMFLDAEKIARSHNIPINPDASKIMLKNIISSSIFFLLINVGAAFLLRESKLVPIAWEAHFSGFLAGLILYPLFALISRRIFIK